MGWSESSAAAKRAKEMDKPVAHAIPSELHEKTFSILKWG